MVGEDLYVIGGELRGSATSDAIRQREWFFHELLHTCLAYSPLGIAQQCIAHGLYLALWALPEGASLDVIRWEVSGRPEVTRLLQRIWALYVALARPVRRVQEFTATSTTVLLYDLILSQIDHAPLREARQRLEQQAARWDPQVWAACIRMRIPDLARGATYREFAYGYRLLASIANELLDDDGLIQDWWNEGGESAAPSLDARFDKMLSALTSEPPTSFGELWDRATTEGLVHPLTGIIPGESTPGAGDRLATGFMPAVSEAIGSTPTAEEMHLRAVLDEVSGFYAPPVTRSVLSHRVNMQLTIPLLSSNAAECPFQAVFPIGSWMEPFIGQNVEDVLGRVTETSDNVWQPGSMRIVPADPEIRFLWGLEQALVQLTGGSFRLECACATTCPGTACVCATVFQPLLRRVTVLGTPLPELRCQVSA